MGEVPIFTILTTRCYTNSNP